ncbi:MAG: hypothetical protein ACYC5S_08330 [Thiobacillus sp.]
MKAVREALRHDPAHGRRGVRSLRAAALPGVRTEAAPETRAQRRLRLA